MKQKKKKAGEWLPSFSLYKTGHDLQIHLWNIVRFTKKFHTWNHLRGKMCFYFMLILFLLVLLSTSQFLPSYHPALFTLCLQVLVVPLRGSHWKHDRKSAGFSVCRSKLKSWIGAFSNWQTWARQWPPRGDFPPPQNRHSTLPPSQGC